jgi:hypothetical protein
MGRGSILVLAENMLPLALASLRSECAGCTYEQGAKLGDSAGAFVGYNSSVSFFRSARAWQ